MLYIVATPIGNLEDITLRALRILKEVDIVAAEDTRHASILLNKYEIRTQLTSFHSFSDNSKTEHIINQLKSGKNVALISDAGTPGISDPGYILIKRALEEGIEVTPIPGASAVITALMASGAPTNEFLYLGFLPLKKGRQTLLTSLQNEERTIVFYESPHRILKTLGDLKKYFPGRNLVIARELTKIHEEFFRGSTEATYDHFAAKTPKGEFTVIISAK